MDTERMFQLDEGTVSPRDRSVAWQTYDTFLSITQAKNEARKSPRRLWRIVEVKVVWKNLRAEEHLSGGSGE